MLKSDKEKREAKDNPSSRERRYYSLVGVGPWYIDVESEGEPAIREVVYRGRYKQDGYEVLEELRADAEYASRMPMLWSLGDQLAHARATEWTVLDQLLRRAEVSRVAAADIAEHGDDGVILLGGLAVGVRAGLQTRAEVTYLNHLLRQYSPFANLLADHGLVHPASAAKSVTPSALARSLASE